MRQSTICAAALLCAVMSTSAMAMPNAAASSLSSQARELQNVQFVNASQMQQPTRRHRHKHHHQVKRSMTHHHVHHHHHYHHHYYH
jgi:hypothetical protein